MKFTLGWLKEYIDIDLSAEELADRLTMVGLEVDSVSKPAAVHRGIVTARILAVKPHPNADKLVLCEVAVGKEQKQVVCGAPNARPGLCTAFAAPGVELPAGLRISETAVRGQQSQGMLLSEKELGISDDHAGIIELPETEAGQPFFQALGLDDPLIDVDLTPNRADCASVIGIAREVSGFTGRQLKLPVNKEQLPELTGAAPFKVEIKAPVDCPRYAARLLRKVRIGPSPWWLKKRLLAIGQRPINNVVDITNYVMMEYGQPLHAFDFNRLSGGRIVVRNAGDGEKFVTLDGVERQLDAKMLLICDAEKAVALAGIMGGRNSEVSDSTTEILLESACFNPLSIRRTARRLNMSSESAYRFERGVDPDGSPTALERAARLIVELAGAELVADGADCLAAPVSRPEISLRVSRTRDLIGMELTATEISALLEGIEIRVKEINNDVLTVLPPSFRVDLEREVDLVEEVARLKGYNEIPSSLPRVPMSFPEQDSRRLLVRRSIEIMIALGFTEAINYGFANSRHFDLLGLPGDAPARKAVRLLNPLSEEQGIMRTMLLPGLLENIKRNINYQNLDLRLFEIGKVFHPDNAESLPVEKTYLTAVLSGRRHPASPLLHYGVAGVDIHDARGALEVVLRDLRLSGLVFETADRARTPVYAQSGSFAGLRAGEVPAGGLGMLDRDVARSFGIKQDVYFFELDLDVLVGLQPPARSFQALPRFPSVKRDIAVLVPEKVQAGGLIEAIRGMGEPLLEGAELFDIYRGKPIEAGLKSVAIAITYRSNETTLSDEIVNKVNQKIIKLVETRYDGRLREAN